MAGRVAPGDDAPRSSDPGPVDGPAARSAIGTTVIPESQLRDTGGPRLRTGTSDETEATVTDTAEIGVFGGSGFYSLLEDVREVKVDTPYGAPSDSIFLAEVAGRRVAFLPRHGRLPHHPAAQDQLPRQRLGDALAGRQGGHLAVRRGLAPAGGQAG